MVDNSNPTPNFPPNVQDILNRGKEVYEGKKADLEQPNNKGKYVVIEVDSKDSFVGETREKAVAEARTKHPRAILFVRKIGGIEKVSRHFPYSTQSQYARLL